MACPDIERIRGSLPEAPSAASRRQIDEHVAGCETCRAEASLKADESSGFAETLRRSDAPGVPAPGAPVAIETSAPLPYGAPIGRYLVLHRLGSGGMSVVYAAFDPQLDRKVALKLLRTDAVPFGGQAVLENEARALARLSHPNVVAVHDVGAVQGQVYLAMELVDGDTLTEWLRAQPRSAQEVLVTVRAAGAGLAAAHSAGLVHRDFKPENVMVGRDGRVRVTDFGLARATHGIRRTGTTGEYFVGTPAYMAPEQLSGEAADASSDQFAFCMALYEALFGGAPFGGETAGSRLEEIRAGRIRPIVSRRHVSSRIRRAVLRGLSADPQARFASMEELLGELSYVTPRSRIAAAIALSVVLVAVGVAAWLPSSASRCTGAAQRFESAWNENQKAEVRRALLATNVPYAARTWERIEHELDAYAARWKSAHTEACEATRVRDEQPEDVLLLRMDCLQQRLNEAAALVHVLTRADEATVRSASTAVGALGWIDQCLDLRALEAGVRLPNDPAARAAAEKLQQRAAEVKAHLTSAQYEVGLERSRSLVDDARKLQLAATEAEALLLLAQFETLRGQFKDAEQILLDSLVVAGRAGADRISARAWTELVRVTGSHLHQFEQAERYVKLGAASIHRAGDDALLEAALLHRAGDVHRHLARYDDAAEALQRAIALRTEILGDEHPLVVEVYQQMGALFWSRGDYAKALAAWTHVQGTQETNLGPDHPDVADAYTNLGVAERARGNLELALSHHHRALAIRERTLSPDHPQIGAALSNIGAALVAKGDPLAALEYLGRAEAIWTAKFGAESNRQMLLDLSTGSALLKLGRYGEALARFERAQRIVEKASGRDHPRLADSLWGIAMAQLGERRAHLAIAPAERALELIQRGRNSPSDRGQTRFVLARALWESGRNRASALELARLARSELESAETAGRAELDLVKAWLATRE